MALINFGYKVDMNSITAPVNTGSYVVAYDLDGLLKQKDHLGNITTIGSIGSVNSTIFYNIGGTVSATNSTTGIYRTGPLSIGTGTASDIRFSVSSSGGTTSFYVNEFGDSVFSGVTKVIGLTLSTNADISPGSILFGTKTSIYSPGGRQIIIGTDTSSYNYSYGWKFNDYQITNLWGNPIEFQNTIGTIGNLFVGSSKNYAGYGFPSSEKSTLFVKGTTASIVKVVGIGATSSISTSIFEIKDSGVVTIGDSNSTSTKLFVSSATSSTTLGSNVMLDLYNSSDDGVVNMLSELAFSAKGQPFAGDPYNNGHRYALLSGYVNQYNNIYSGGGLIFSTRESTASSLTERMRITNAGNVGIGVSPVNSAILQIDSTTKGFLPPRMTNTQRTSISSPAIGLIVYCTDTTEGLYVYKSGGWQFIA